MARFPAVTNQSTAAVVAFLVSHGADLGTVPSCCQPPSRLFLAGCRWDVGRLPEQGGQGCFPSLCSALSFPTDGRQRGQCQCLSGTASGWRDACLLSCSTYLSTTPLRPCFSPWKGKGLLDVPGVAQGWGGRRQSLLENTCKPRVCSLVPGLWVSGHGDSCVTPPSSA